MTQTLKQALLRQRLSLILFLTLPAVCFIVSDFYRRGDRILALEGFYAATYVAAVVESAALWSLLLYAAAGRRGPGRWVATGLFVTFVTLTFGGQQYFFEQYNAYLNIDVSLFASNFMESVASQLAADIGNYLQAKLPPLVLSLLLVWWARRWVRPQRTRARIAQALAPIAVIAAFFIPTQHRSLQAATPDVLYLNAVGGLISTQLGFTEQSQQLRPRARESLPVIRQAPPRANPPNVLFLILESVRSDATCISYDPSCRRTEYSNRLVPERFPLRQLRSLASSTAISLAVLWSGVGPHEEREVLHTWPLLFDYARAANYDTAFWTSQNMMFGNARLWVKNLGVSKFVSATDLDPTCDIDLGAPEQLLARRVNQEIGQLQEPFLAVVQFSNGHFPYYVDPEGPLPFQPASTSKAPEDNTKFFNYYLNAIHQQDQHVASIIEQLRASDAGSRTVIVYTSDHGEAFREHNQMGHTFSVLDEEVHVPGWIDAPAGTLSEAQRANLQAKVDTPTFHVDLSATVLDLIGMWDDPGIAPYKQKMLGESLLSATPNTRALPLTNCAGVWSCAFENWGYMRQNFKLEARSWDSAWHCYDLARDPFELTDLGPEACGDLREQALSTFGRLPGKKE